MENAHHVFVYILNMKRDRIYYFDYYKGLLIILVVLGHIMPEDAFFHKYIYAWHMHAFFMVSGMLLKYTFRTDRKFFGKTGIIAHSIKKLIIPYYAYGLLLLIARWISSGMTLDNLRWQSIDLLSFCGIGAMWFLPCLFIAQLIYTWFRSVFDKLSGYCLHSEYLILFIKISFAIILFVFACILPHNNTIALVTLRGAVATSYCFIGDIAFDVITLIRKMRLKLVSVCALFIGVLSILVFKFTGENISAINMLTFSNPFLFLLNSILGTIFGALIAAIIEKLKFPLIERAFLFYGKNSLIIMGTH